MNLFSYNPPITVHNGCLTLKINFKQLNFEKSHQRSCRPASEKGKNMYVYVNTESGSECTVNKLLGDGEGKNKLKLKAHWRNITNASIQRMKGQ